MPSRLLPVSVVLALAAALSADAQAPQESRGLPSVHCLVFSPDGDTLAAAYGDQMTRGVLAAWDVETFRPRFEVKEEVAFPSIAYSPDGRVLALARFAPEAKLLDAESGELIREFAGHKDHVRCVAFTPDGQKLVTGSYDRTVKLWDAATGAEEATFEGHTGPVYAVAVSPDGQLLATADARSNTARLWELSSGKPLHAWENLGSLVPHVVFSPDGKLVAAASWGGHLSLFDVNTYQPWLRIRDIGGPRWSAFSPDGRRLAVASNGPTVYVFDANAKPDEATKIRVAELLAEFDDDSYEVRQAAHRRLEEIGMAAERQLCEAMKSDSPELRWRARRLRERLARPDSAVKLEGHTAELSCVAFSPDGRFLASGDEEGVIRLWSAPEWTPVANLLPAGE